MRAIWLFVFCASLGMATLAACGGSSNPRKYDGQSASAVVQFFEQERAGGRLPEGTSINGVGTGTIRSLAVTSDQKKQSVTARNCVEYTYTTSKTPFTKAVRVYVATLTKGTWAVEAVKPNGTCDDVV